MSVVAGKKFVSVVPESELFRAMVLTKQIELRTEPRANLLNDVPAETIVERNIFCILKLFAILAKGAEVAQLQ